MTSGMSQLCEKAVRPRGLAPAVLVARPSARPSCASLNTEEREILEKFERDELKSASGADREMKIAPQAARNTFNKTRRVNLRVTERDFNLAHARAREEGIPYQTLLSSVIHKYLSGRLTKKRSS